MPGSFTATAFDMRAAAAFLDALTAATSDTDVKIWERFTIQLPGDSSTIDVQWTDEGEHYVIDDQVGR